MKGQASAPKPKKGSEPKFLHLNCRRLILEAQCEADEVMIATVYRTLFGVNTEGLPVIVTLDPKQPGQLGYWGCGHGESPAGEKAVLS